MSRIMLNIVKKLRQYMGGILIAVAVAGMGEAAMFGWVWRDGVGPHIQATSVGLVAVTHFMAQFWPVLPICIPVLLLGLWLAWPPKEWFGLQAFDGKK